jgi:2-C-methyl-D-erythritol 4-phosphate cytidylyltransferase
MIDDKKVSVVIPAAGAGKRMGAPLAKQFLALQGTPILLRTLERFDSAPEVDEIVVAAAAEEVGAVLELVRSHALKKVRAVVPGGKERQDSVWNALEATACDIVLVHDAVRPFVSHHLISSVATAALRTGAAVAAVAPKETIKISDGSGTVLSTPDRTHLWIAQTPQGFAYDLLVEAYRQAQKEGFYGTDDASLVERLGIKVVLVEGSYDNIKITTPEDVELAERILARVTRGSSHLVF